MLVIRKSTHGRELQRANGSVSLALLSMSNGPVKCSPSRLIGVGAAGVFHRYGKAGIGRQSRTGKAGLFIMANLGGTAG